ncbi:MAG TPA: acetyl-CoA carboxylase biotin carboxyl carrier protein [Solirubrobacteraceae bacterium]|nr:acetyl-CoA carboxylase biotin carboxyl carrier protein [Solirubrobacteraceae bacterium]
MPLSDEDVREILRIIDESDLAELQIETEDFSLYVRKGGGDAEASGRPRVRSVSKRAPAGRAPGGPEASASPPPTDGTRDGLATIPAPMLGTFYRAEAPGKPPFVDVGTKVEPDTIVCIIEVMKMMNSVSAGVSGTVTEVIAENAHLVEYGEPLFRVEPEPA